MGSEVCTDELMNEENPSKNPISSSKEPCEISADKLMNEENPSRNPISILKEPNEICGKIVKEAKNAQSLEPEGSQKSCIRPATPDSSRENGDQNHVLSSPLTVVLSSPLTVVSSPNHALSSPLTVVSSLPSNGNGLETPKETLFDSFAPGPDKFMLAPHPRKYREESRNHVVRRLNFNCAVDLVKDFSHKSGVETLSEEESLFEFVYATILDAIFSEQTKELKLVAKFVGQDSEFAGWRTPKCARILSGVAETCPGAPMKLTSKWRSIDKEICKKLEF